MLKPELLLLVVVLKDVQQSAWFTGSSALSGDTARTRQGLEAAFAWNGLKLQGEQFNFKYDPTTGDTIKKLNGSLCSSNVYNLTGEITRIQRRCIWLDQTKQSY
jgi:phosphate-selective porin